MNKLNNSDTTPIFDLNFNTIDGEYKRTIIGNINIYNNNNNKIINILFSLFF